MKSAKDWLNSSSSSDGGASSPSPSAAGTGVSSAAAEPAAAAPSAADAARQKRAQEAEERRRKAAELREKMKETLGADAVPPPRADTEGPPISLQSPVIIRRKSAGGTAAAPPPKPSLKDRLKGVLDSSTETSNNGTPLNSGGGPPPFMPPVKPMSSDAVAMPADDEVVIMVADRGCQTVCEIETQTDPEPHTVSCPMCYSAYYGHSGAPPPLCGSNGSHSPAPVYMFGGAHGPAMQPMHPHMHGPAGVQTAQALGARFGPQGYGGYGGGGAPHQQRLVPAHVYQRQVDLIQSRIDAIIRKHNLPEMPTAGFAAADV